MTTAIATAAAAQASLERQYGRTIRPTTFMLSDLAAHCDRWRVDPDCCYFSIEDGVIYLYFCRHGDDITEEMKTSECMDIRMSTDRDGQDVPLLQFTDITEYSGIHPDAIYELRYIADYA
jgi:hypothetical protein